MWPLRRRFARPRRPFLWFAADGPPMGAAYPACRIAARGTARGAWRGDPFGIAGSGIRRRSEYNASARTAPLAARILHHLDRPDVLAGGQRPPPGAVRPGVVAHGQYGSARCWPRPVPRALLPRVAGPPGRGAGGPLGSPPDQIVADGAVALASAALAWTFGVASCRPGRCTPSCWWRAAGNLFHWPAMQASTALMVPERTGRGWPATTRRRAARGYRRPAAGRAVVGAHAHLWRHLLDVATAAMAIVPLCFVAVPQPERAAGRCLVAPRSAAGARLRKAPGGPAARCG